MRYKFRLLGGMLVLSGIGFLAARCARSYGPASGTPTERVSAAVNALVPPINNSSAPISTPIAAVTRSGADTASTSIDTEETLVAIRYDKTRVLFEVADERSDFQLDEARTQKLQTLGATSAEYGGGDVWKPDAELLSTYHELFERTHAGEEWRLEVSGNSRMAVFVKEPVVVNSGCFASAAFLAEVGPQSQPEFAASPVQYFLIRRGASSHPENRSLRIGALPDWRATAEVRSQIEQLLQRTLKEEIAKVHAQSVREYERAENMDVSRRPWADGWREMDRRLALGEGTVDFDLQAFQLSADGIPRLFVRARWTIDQKAAFLMSAWLSAGSAVTVEQVDSREAQLMREGEFIDAPVELTNLGNVVNVFDHYGDGNGELLFYMPGYESYELRLFRYSNRGPVRTEIAVGGGC